MKDTQTYKQLGLVAGSGLLRAGALAVSLAAAGCQTLPKDDMDITASGPVLPPPTERPDRKQAFHITGSATAIGGAQGFCQRHPDDCGPSSRFYQAASYHLVDSQTVEAIHASTMTRVRMISDQDKYGVEEYWTYLQNDEGDCEDIQLENSRILMSEHGLHPDDKIFLMVREWNRAGHLVMAVKTSDKGWMVMDNLSADSIYPMEELSVRYAELVKASSNLTEWFHVEQDTIRAGYTP